MAAEATLQYSTKKSTKQRKAFKKSTPKAHLIKLCSPFRNYYFAFPIFGGCCTGCRRYDATACTGRNIRRDMLHAFVAVHTKITPVDLCIILLHPKRLVPGMVRSWCITKRLSYPLRRRRGRLVFINFVLRGLKAIVQLFCIMFHVVRNLIRPFYNCATFSRIFCLRMF